MNERSTGGYCTLELLFVFYDINNRHFPNLHECAQKKSLKTRRVMQSIIARANSGSVHLAKKDRDPQYTPSCTTLKCTVNQQFITWRITELQVSSIMITTSWNCSGFFKFKFKLCCLKTSLIFRRIMKSIRFHFALRHFKLFKSVSQNRFLTKICKKYRNI